MSRLLYGADSSGCFATDVSDKESIGLPFTNGRRRFTVYELLFGVEFVVVVFFKVALVVLFSR